MNLNTLKYFLLLILSICSLSASKIYGQETIKSEPLVKKNTNTELKLKTENDISVFSFIRGENIFRKSVGVNFQKSKLVIRNSNDPAFYFGIGVYKSFSLYDNAAGYFAGLISGNIKFKFTKHFLLNTGIDIYKAKYSSKVLLSFNVVPSLGFFERKTQFSFGIGATFAYGESSFTVDPIASIKVDYFFKNNIAITTELKNIIDYSDYINFILTFGVSFIL